MPTLEPFPWPKLGLVESTALSEQPELATTDCLNVRAFDAFDRRNRGGQRSGITKHIDAQPASTNDIQNINSQVQVLQLSEEAGFTEKYGDPSTAFADDEAEAAVAFNPDGDRVVFLHEESSTLGYIRVYEWDDESGFGARVQKTADLVISPTSISGVTSFAECRLRFSPDGDYLMVKFGNTTDTSPVLFIYPFSKATGLGTAIPFPAITGISIDGWNDACWHPDGDQIIIAFNAISTARNSVRAYAWSGGAFGAVIDTVTHASGTSLNPSIDIHPDGTGVVIGTGGLLYSYAYDKIAGFSAENTISSSGGTCYYVSFSPTGEYVAYTNSIGSPDSVFIHAWEPGSGLATGVSTQFDQLSPGQCHWHPSGNYILVSARNSDTNIKVFPWTGAFGSLVSQPATTPGSNVGGSASWSPSGVTLVISLDGDTPTVPYAVGFNADPVVNPSARRLRLIVTAGGNVFRSNLGGTGYNQVGGSSDQLVSTGPVCSMEAFQNMFFCDSFAANYKYLRYSDNTLRDWTTDLVAGDLPVGTTDTTLGCRIIALYRGRVVLAGLKEEPHNWFMSRAGNPFDWDYAPADTSPTDPVAGNNSEAGQLGDVLTALAPFNDDILIMGGANSIWMMAGDPAAGGQIDNISRQIGIVGPDAWTWDLAGNLYFFGINGLYRMTPGGLPELVSRNKLDNTFGSVDVSSQNISLVYDPRWQGVHIFFSPSSEPTQGSLHYFYDERNDAFWVDRYPAAVGPTTVHTFKADNPEDTSVLLGGFDGYVRRFEDDAMDDDGTAITSYVRFSPKTPGGIYGSARMDDAHFILDQQSDPVTARMWVGDTVEEVERLADAAGTPAWKVSLIGGRNNTIRRRVAGNAIMLELSQEGLAEGGGAGWAYEAGGCKTAVITRLRGRHVS